MYFGKRAQGTIEYLVIISMVVGLLFGLPIYKNVFDLALNKIGCFCSLVLKAF